MKPTIVYDNEVYKKKDIEVIRIVKINCEKT